LGNTLAAYAERGNSPVPPLSSPQNSRLKIIAEPLKLAALFIFGALLAPTSIEDISTRIDVFALLTMLDASMAHASPDVLGASWRHMQIAARARFTPSSPSLDDPPVVV
jgi:hypothetical protein